MYNFKNYTNVKKYRLSKKVCLICSATLLLIFFLPPSSLSLLNQCCPQSSMEGAGFNLRSRLSTYSLGAFCCFLRNSCTYGLGSLRKTHTESTLLIKPYTWNGQVFCYHEQYTFQLALLTHKYPSIFKSLQSIP